MYFNPYALPLFAFTLVMAAMAALTWRFRTSRGAIYFTLLSMASALYSFTYALEISSVTLDLILFWIGFEYIGVALIPALLILFATAFAGRMHRLTFSFHIFLLTISLLTIIFVFTNGSHGLIYSRVFLDQSGFFPTIGFERGPWYWVHSFYVLIAILYTNFVLGMMWIGASHVYRKQISIMLAGALVPLFGFIFYLLRPFTWSIDLNPYILAISSILFFWGLLRYRLFDLIPIARTKLFEDLPDGALILDSNLRIIDLNSAARQFFDLKEEVIGQSVHKVLTQWPKLVRMIQSAAGKFHVELPRDHSGYRFWFRVDFIPLKEGDSEPFGKMIIIRDITDRKRAEDELKRLATTDELTGLRNRRYFRKAVADELNRAKRNRRNFSLLLLDLDHFKTVNDQYGHSAGDEVLQQLGSRLRKRLRAIDLAARIGGEEFAILLPETDLPSALHLGDELLTMIKSNPIRYADQDIFVTASIGAAASHYEISSVDELLKIADQALYKSKEKGRDCIIG